MSHHNFVMSRCLLVYVCVGVCVRVGVNVCCVRVSLCMLCFDLSFRDSGKGWVDLSSGTTEFLSHDFCQSDTCVQPNFIVPGYCVYVLAV